MDKTHIPEDSSPEVRLFTVSNKRTIDLYDWETTAKTQGWQTPEIAGLGQPWEGWKTKMSMILAYASRQPPDQIIMYTDAFDVVLNNGPVRALEVYRKHGRDIVWGVEANAVCIAENCAVSDVTAVCKRPNATQRNKINAGCFIGKAGTVVEAQTWMLAHNPSDDQAAAAKWAVANCERCGFDVDQELVMNTWPVGAQPVWSADLNAFVLPDNAQVAPVAIHMLFQGLDPGRVALIRNQLIVGYIEPELPLRAWCKSGTGIAVIACVVAVFIALVVACAVLGLRTARREPLD